MASGGSDISARISAEDEKIDYNALKETARKHFIQQKVDISDAIKKVFPFLEILRDRGFITDKIYEESYKSFQKSLPMEKVVYDVLEELEKTFKLPLLDTLFCKVIMKNYPDLNGIREGFRYVIIEKIYQEARDRERSAENLNTPLSLDQGIGKNFYETLPWLAPDPSSDNDVHGEFIYPLGGQAVTNPMLALDSGTATAEPGTSEDHLEIQEISANEAGTTSDNEQHAQESVPAGTATAEPGTSEDHLEIQEISANEAGTTSDNEQHAQESVPAGTATAEPGTSEDHLEIQEISANEAGTTSDNEQHAQESVPAGTATAEPGTSEDHLEIQEISANEAGTTSDNEQHAQESVPAGTATAEPGTSEDHLEIQEISANEAGTTSDNEQHAQESVPAGAADLRETSTSEIVWRRKWPRNHKKESVDFSSETLPVTCGEKRGLLIKRRFKRGATVKCIRTEDGNWFSPNEFKIEGGYQKSSNWKTSLRCGGETLKCLMKLGNSDICEICQYGENLFCCDTCSKFFHGDCHLPPMEPESTRWSCTFCAIEKPSRTQQCYSESEILARQMGPEEKLKCEYSLLKVYCRLEGIVVRAIPHENYVEKASQCLEKLKTLDEIKKTLTERRYPQVEGFVRDMDRIFQGPSCNDSDGIEEEFKKNFKEVFAIQKRN